MEEKSRKRAKEYFRKEPVVNSYQIARLKEDESEVKVAREHDTIKGVLIKKDSTITLRGEESGLKKLMKDFENGKEFRFHAVDPISFEALKNLLDIEDDRPTWLLKRIYFEPGKPDSEVRCLRKDDAEIINEYWGLSGSDSTDYIKERIEKGPAYGIRRNGELVGWCLTHFVTDRTMMLGMLHIKEDWRRKGFAKDLTEKLCSEAREKDLIPAVQIFKDNEPSLSLAKGLGFEIRGEHHWFNGSKE